MMNSGGIVTKCRFCHALYRFYPHMVGDQSVCPACRKVADDSMTREPWRPWHPPKRPVWSLRNV